MKEEYICKRKYKNKNFYTPNNNSYGFKRLMQSINV